MIKQENNLFNSFQFQLNYLFYVSKITLEKCV